MLYHCLASLKQSLLDFFNLVDSRLILMLCMTLRLIISGVHQSYLGSWGHKSETVKLRGLDYVAYKMFQCAVLLKDKIIIVVFIVRHFSTNTGSGYNQVTIH